MSALLATSVGYSAHTAAADVSDVLDISVVVPIGPDDDAWRTLQPQLAALNVREVVFVFAAGHVPRGLPEDSKAGVRIISAAAGRARQLNAGAAVSKATWIWFVHADSALTEGTAAALRRYLARDGAGLGYFDLRFQADGPQLTRLNEIGAWLRSRWLQLPFGDQGFVLPKHLFEALGGFDAALECGEDHDFIWRARARSVAVRPLGTALYTSARKYARDGWLRTTWRHLRASWQQARAFSRKART